jgi:hypothetical protein
MSASEELRRLDDALTPGPWHQVLGQPFNPDLLSRERYEGSPEFGREEDAASVVALRNALPALIALVSAAEKADYALNAKWPLYEPVRKLGDALAALDRVLEGEEP